MRVPAYSPHAVAEHAVGLLLTLNRKIHRAYNRVRELNFSLSGLVGFDIRGKTVGIIGTGKIGQIAAQIFCGFEANVMAHDPFPAPDWAKAHGIQYTDLDTLLAASDILSLHLPLMPETLHLLNVQTISRTKPGVFIVNTSRGKLIDTTALIAALKSGHIGGEFGRKPGCSDAMTRSHIMIPSAPFKQAWQLNGLPQITEVERSRTRGS